MPNPDRPEFSYLEINRAVSGPQVAEFRDKVEFLGNKLFGYEERTFITEPPQPDDEDEFIHAHHDITVVEQTRIIGPPRLDVYDLDDFAISLLHRRVPRDLQGGSSFTYAANKLARATYGESSPSVHSKRRASVGGGLQKAMVRIGLQHDIPCQENVPITFSSITLNTDPTTDSKGPEIALVPDAWEPATKMLIDQSAFCFRTLSRVSRKTAYPTARSVPLNLPFVRLPVDFAPEETREFMHVIQDEYLPVRGLMGVVHRQPTVYT